jgi:hypothetical protein
MDHWEVKKWMLNLLDFFSFFSEKALSLLLLLLLLVVVERQLNTLKFFGNSN